MADWHHAPVHRLESTGAYMVTAGTYHKMPYFNDPERLTLLCDALFRLANEYGWLLQAWAIMSNHYHFVAISPSNPGNLWQLVARLHSYTATEVNRLDRYPGRKVWHQYWDTHLTYQSSYLARLKYVHHNPVHHNVVAVASMYPWCSATWFENTADRVFQQVIAGFIIDRVNVNDDFDDK